MRFKLDEYLPLEMKAALAAHQHDSETVADEEMSGSVDPDVMQACRAENRALLTLDLDFSDIRTYPPENCQGIIVFRPAVQSISALLRLTTRVIALLEHEPLVGRLWIVEDHRVRIREGTPGSPTES